MAVHYLVDIEPRNALLGEPLTATLRCVASEDTPGVITFTHKSLVLKLGADGMIEPILAFPNRFAIEERGRLIRTSLPGGVEYLSKGESRVRQFDLAEYFVGAVLSVTTISFSYWFEESEPPVQVEPLRVEVQSGPDTVQLLVDRLNAESSDIGLYAGQLLRRISARDFSDKSDWPRWWAEEGARLPWNYGSDGATFGETPPPPPPTRRSGHLGGVAYPSSAPARKPHE